jgi:hypothetical protein
LASLENATSPFSLFVRLFLYAGVCTIEYDRSETSCLTVQTELKVKYRGSQEENNLVDEYVQSIIHNRIVQNSKQLFVMDIVGIHWTNESEFSHDIQIDINELQPGNTSTSFNTPIKNDVTPSNHRPRIMSPQIIIPLSTGIMSLIFWMLCHFYSRSQQRQITKTVGLRQASKDGHGDIESGSVTTAPTISPTHSGRDFASDCGTPERKSATPSTEISSNVMLGKPVRRSAPVSVDSPDRRPLPVSVDSPDRSAAGLPPRPPRRNSIQLKKNRKKKKKKKGKKVVALKRVNSREGINEMPMISESDEDSEHGSEGDSEYTWDDGSSIEASSGCLTPARSSSLSRRSSRTSSPQLSPRDEMFAADGFDHDVEFVFEAFDFPTIWNSSEDDLENLQKKDDTNISFSKRTFTGDNLANSLRKELTSFEIEPPALNGDGASPKRRLPLPWLK